MATQKIMQSDTDLTPERKKMKTTGRPLQAVVYTLLFLLSGIFMALLGMSASAWRWCTPNTKSG